MPGKPKINVLKRRKVKGAAVSENYYAKTEKEIIDIIKKIEHHTPLDLLDLHGLSVELASQEFNSAAKVAKAKFIIHTKIELDRIVGALKRAEENIKHPNLTGKEIKRRKLNIKILANQHTELKQLLTIEEINPDR